MRPGLTLLCFTRDEAPKLMRLLESVQGVVDDIVVVDTGSKDLSPGVARMAGARVYEIEWPGSFADVFNYAIPLVETEWSIRLDTDEWLAPGSGPILRRAMGDPTAAAYNLIREDIVGDGETNEIYQMRMWRTDYRVRFEGLIHEYVPPAIQALVIGKRKVYNLPARFRHDGYEGGISPEKIRRNVELLRQELELRPGRLYFQVDLARSLAALGEEEGRLMLRELAASAPVQDPAAPEMFVAYFDSLEGSELDRPEVNAAVVRALESLGSHPPLLWSVAILEKRRGRWEECRRLAEQLLDLLSNPDQIRRTGFRSNARAQVEALIAEADQAVQAAAR